MKKTKLMAALTASAMALSMAVPFNVSAIKEPPAVELYETYHLDDFLELDEETVTSIRQELAPDVDAAAECEAVKAAGEAAIANGEIIISGFISMDYYYEYVWGGSSEAEDLFSLDCNGVKGCLTYELKEIGGADHVSFEVNMELSDYTAFTAADVYRIYVWITANPEAVETAVEDTSYTACGLTKEELYEKYDFDAIMELSPEEICSFSKEIKERYEKLVNETAFFGFTEYFDVGLTKEYKANIPFYTDPVAARETVIKDTGIAEDLCWGIITPYNETTDTTSVSLYFHSDKVTSYAEYYGLERSDLAARLWVYLSLNPNVTGVSGGVVSTAPTGILPDMIHYSYEFDDILAMDMKQIFDLVLYTPLLYVDALAYARDNGFDEYTDLTDYSFILKSTNLDNTYDPDDLGNAFEFMCIDKHWVKDGTIISRGDQQYQFILNDVFVSDYLNFGNNYETLFASVYLWLTASMSIQEIIIEENTEPDVLERYTFEEFAALSEEEILELFSEAEPTFDAKGYCDAIKTATLDTLENNVIEMSVYVTPDLLSKLFPFGSGSGAEAFCDEYGIPAALVTEAEKAYGKFLWQGAAYYEIKVEFSVEEVLAQPYAPEDFIYRICAWLCCDDRIPDVDVKNTDYISIGLTEAEVYNKYTFEEFMTLSTEEICGITEELKEMYEETAPAARELGFNKQYKINFSAEYQNTVDVPYYTDPVAARKMIREELRIPEELYRGIITPTYSGREYPTINLYISDKNLEEFTARYNCDEAEVAARLLVWLNLNPNVTSAGGGYTPEGVAGGVNPHYMYDDKGFENVLASDIKGIFHLPYDASLYYVDALEIAQELGIDDETNLCTYTYKVKINNWNGYYTDGVFTNYTELFETLHITEDWLRNGTISGPFADAESEKSIWFDIDLDEDLYNSCLAQGYDNTDIMATIYMWLGYGAAQDISFEANPDYTEPEVKYGEVNRDGQVSLLDVVALCKYNAGSVMLNDSQLKAADCTGDGVINGSDITALQMFIVEKISILPIAI